MPRRIMIIGCSGAGKSTLARRLGPLLGLPVIHLDREHWRPGWREPEKEEWRAKVRELAARPEWIIDGNYGGTRDERIHRAEMVVFLDFPRWRCLWRVIRRRIQYHRRTRPDMAPNCPEKIDWEFVRWIWGYSKRERPVILRQLQENRDGRQVAILHNPAEVRRYLRAFRKAGRKIDPNAPERL